MSVCSQHHGKYGFIRFDTDLLAPTETNIFDTDWLQAKGYIRQSGMGRGGVYILDFAGRNIVLRFFQRGGLMRKVNRDRYLRLGLERSRSFCEYELLRWMRSQGLEVPRPIAAMTVPIGPFYRAAIILEHIPGARTLADILKEASLPDAIWRDIGKAIRQMHDLGVFHADLNCRNILIDDQDRIWLIDFDKSRRRKAGTWKTRNIERLKRSLLKERRRTANLWMDNKDWSQVVAGYMTSRDEHVDVVAKRA